MKSKTIKGRIHHTVSPDERFVAPIRDITKGETGVLWEFIKSKDLSHQLSSLKKLFNELDLAGHNGSLSAMLDLLTHCYIITTNKNPLKRALASFLQSAHGQYPDPCQTILKDHLTSLLTNVDLNDVAAVRVAIDNIASLHENFPLGELSVLNDWHKVLIFVCTALESLHLDTRKITGVVIQTERMHDCLVTIQVWTKILQKSSHKWETELTDELREHIQRGFAVICDILSDDAYLLDCRSAAGLAIPLTIRVATESAGGSTVLQILGHFFPQYLPSSPPDVIKWLLSALEPRDQLRQLSEMPFLCICNGCLALLDPCDLTSEFHEGQILLTTVLAQEILNVIPRLETTNAKLLASKSLALWATKACYCLEGMHTPSEGLLASHLCGDAPIASRVIEYAWTHWEDPVDLIRHQARHIFEKLLRCHLLATGEAPHQSAYLQTLLGDLLAMGWHLKGKYGPLCSLLDYLPATLLLQKNPDLPTQLLQASNEQTLACYVNELYEKLFTCHLNNLKVAASVSGAQYLEGWYSVWVDPILKVLCGHTSHLHKTHIIEYTLPKLLKCCPECVSYITHTLTASQPGVDNLGALVTCLKRAKMMGILKPDCCENRDMWNGVVAMENMKRALCHPDEQVRLDSLGLLCENHKTTEVITQLDFTLLKFFLPLNMSSQTPAFRQKLVAMLKKLFLRIRDGTVTLKRKRKEAKSQDAKEMVENHLDEYKLFLTWLCNLAFSCLHPLCGFPSRTTALASLSMLVHILGNGHDADAEVEFSFCREMTAAHIETLLECFTDTFENNKQEALTLLLALPVKYIQILDISRLTHLLQAGLDLASSTRPQDCTTAAYLLRILLSQERLKEAIDSYRFDADNCGDKQMIPLSEQSENITSKSQDKKISGDASPSVPCERNYLLLSILVEMLQDQLGVAQKSLLHAAATRPMYPTLNCIRYILTDTALQKLGGNSAWQQLLATLVTVCFKVADVVTPVVSNSSPEGNVPVESIGAAFDTPETDVDEHLLKEANASETTVRLMPEYLVVCAWRSIKEVSLLLGQVTASAPVIDPKVEDTGGNGLLSLDQLESIGAFFSTQLLESIHRGAFELAYAGFIKMSEMLWRSKIEAVHALPGRWLSEVMDDVRSNDPDSRLCSTRRSAGVPFFVQALVTMEPTTNGRMLFRQVLTELLLLAQQPETIDGVENTAKVHSLNILRALYRDTRLADDVFPFIAEGLQVAILGYASQSWNVRNSSTLLFSALITRIFGVNRTKDEANRKNCLTGRVFFNRYPSLYPFLLEQMTEATSKIGSRGRFHLHPGLYPVLMVMGRLYPSVLEGADTNLSLSPFIHHILSCASSPVYKTRIMAARAISPIVSKDQLISVLHTLTSCLVRSPQDGTASQNLIHGALLQLRELSRDIERLPGSLRLDAMTVVIRSLIAATWIVSHDNPCLMTRAAYIELALPLLKMIPFSSNEGLNGELVMLKDHVIAHVKEQIFTEATPSTTPWLAEYQEVMTAVVLTSCTRGSETLHQQSDILCDMDMTWITSMLKSAIYEVRSQVLDHILDVLSGSCSDDLAKHEEERVNSVSHQRHIKDSILESETIFGVLIAMVMDTELHPECLTKALTALCYFTKSSAFPWRVDDKSWTVEQVVHRLMLLQSAPRDELRCAAHELSGSSLSNLYSSLKQESKLESVVRDWCELLPVRCAVQQSETARLTCAKILVKNAAILLVDTDRLLGEMVVPNWTVVMRLLQDEEVTVRETMATVLIKLKEYLPPHLAGLLSQDVGVQSELAVDLCLHVMSAVFCQVALHASLMTSCCDRLKLLPRTWVEWIINDLEPDDQEEKEVRLFDKGEMNTYHNNIMFVELVSRHLGHLLKVSSSCPHPSNLKSCGDSEKTKIQESSQKCLDPLSELPTWIECDVNVMRETGDGHLTRFSEDFAVEYCNDELHSHVTSVCKDLGPFTAKTPFLRTSWYNHMTIEVYRLSRIHQCLSHISSFDGLLRVQNQVRQSVDNSYVSNMLMRSSLS